MNQKNKPGLLLQEQRPGHKKTNVHQYYSKRVSTSEVKSYAINHWSEILSTLAPELSPIIERGRRHGPCPLCGGKDRARCHSDFEDTGGIFCNQCRGGADGFSVLMWANGSTFPEALEAVKSYLGLDDGQILIARPVSSKTKQIPAKNWDDDLRRMEAVWCKATQDTGRIAKYFKYRGLSVSVPDTLRLHPNLYYYEQGPSDRYPCMIAEIILDGQRVGIHRTWFDSNGFGKAPCSQPRKTWKCVDSMTGGAIQLFEAKPDKPLVITEGIETALAVRELTGLPAWSAINSTMLETVRLPENIKSVVICADLDKSKAGQRAADKLAKRLINEGREIKISYPPISIPENSKGVDWLDYLRSNEVAHV